jgi:ComF family protein
MKAPRDTARSPKISQILLELGDRLLSLLYPQRCVFCGKVVEYDDFFCETCRDLPQPKRLADAIPTVAAYRYEGGARHAVLTLKITPDSRTVTVLCGAMCRALEQEHFAFDFVVPVPISPHTRRKRGYNQAKLLAEPVAAHFGKPLCEEALTRLNAGAVQHKLGARERQKNAAASFQKGQAAQVRGKRVLLLDDVHTTGSTLAACGALLYSLGAVEVCAVTAAYVDKNAD